MKLSLGSKDNYKTVLRTEIFGMRESISRFKVNETRILNWKYQYDLLRFIFIKKIFLAMSTANLWKQ